MYEQDTLSALGVITEAQRIAFAPMLFQATLCLCNAGILDYLDQQGKRGAPLNAVTEHAVLNEHAMGVLLDTGLGGRIITCREGIYYLMKIGHYFLHDIMTRANVDFTQDVYYQGLSFLVDSLNEGKPFELKVFSDWPTIYPALSQSPGTAHDNWFAFDHYYSGGTFNAVLSYVFANNPTTLCDVGGNMGKWALRCCKFNGNVVVTLLNLPQQVVLAKEDIANTGFSGRIDLHATDMLSDVLSPSEANI